MKRYLLILFVIISLLVSCSTTKVKQPETPAEPPVAEAPAAQETVPAAEEAKEAEAPVEEAPEAEAPAEEEAAAEEQHVEEQEVTEEIPAEAEAQEAPAEEESTSDEQDWSQVIGSAPAEQAPQAQPEPEKAPEAPAAEPAKEAPKAEKVPAQTPARKSSFTDKIISIVKKVGNFVSEQILLSIGLFVCFGGIVYLIVVLAISGRRERQRRPAPARKAPRENTSFEPGQDKEPQTDDDFLKSLLGDDSN